MSRRIDCTELRTEICKLESPHRSEHSISVAKTNVMLARRYREGIDETVLTATGLLHDLCREWSDERLYAFCEKHHVELEREEQACPWLLHSPVAAGLLREEGYPEEMCVAIRWHTLGSVSMGRLGLIVFISDYLEPHRTHITEDERRQLLLPDTLEGVCLAVLTLQDAYFREKGRCNAAVTDTLERFLKEGGRL
ncbi:MAG: bis(5'-nucleosyl)-tetraphosphatase (symmetrical) YqeK [Sphaerochaetaceae bacterium]